MRGEDKFQAVGAHGADPSAASPWRIRDGVMRAAPVLVPLGAFGLAVGVMSRSAGLDIVQTVTLSATTFAGTAQFAALDLLTVSGVVAAVSAGALLNLRYLPMGFTVAPALSRARLGLRLAQAQLSVDESWALSETAPGRHDRSLLIGSGLAMYAVWVTTSALGYLVGRHVDPTVVGLDVAATTIFVGLLVRHLRSPGRWQIASAGAIAAVSVTLLVSSGAGIFAAAIVGLTARAPR